MRAMMSGSWWRCERIMWFRSTYIYGRIEKMAKIKLNLLNLPSYRILQMNQQSILQVPQMLERNACKHFDMLTVCNLIFEFQTLDQKLAAFSCACPGTGMPLQ